MHWDTLLPILISYITGGVGNRRMVHAEVCTMYTVQAFTGVQKYIGTM